MNTFNDITGVWHVQGDWIPQQTIADLREYIIASAYMTDAIFVKTSNGTRWQGTSDSKAAMAITGPDAVERWVEDMDLIEVHGWAVVRGLEPEKEADLIIAACKDTGLESMILDVEPFSNYWAGTEAAVHRLCSRIREGLGDDFHLALCPDARLNWYAKIYPQAWQPYVNSVHPQCYWQVMGRSPADVIAEAYATWGNYGKGIYPVLQTWNVDGRAIREAQDVARNRHGASGLSYFRLGVIGPSQWTAINVEQVESADGYFYGDETILTVDGDQFYHGAYYDADQPEFFASFETVRGHEARLAPSQPIRQRIWTGFLFRDSQFKDDAVYEVATYIPSRGNAQHAAYHILTAPGEEVVVEVDQSRVRNRWETLYTGPLYSNGAVYVGDLTGEVGREVVFAALRVREVTNAPILSAGFDSPVGTEEERRAEQVWPGDWFDATGYAVWYGTTGGAYHTGADLNLNKPTWDSDKNALVYAAGAGVVVFAGRPGGSWGQVVILRHDPLPTGEVVWSRYAHLSEMLVAEGMRIGRGGSLGRVGNADGRFAYHLHFDIARNAIIESQPGHWPGGNLAEVLRIYHNPQTFIKQNRPA